MLIGPNCIPVDRTLRSARIDTYSIWPAAMLMRTLQPEERVGHKQYQAESLGNQQAPKADEGEEIRDPCVPLSLR